MKHLLKLSDLTSKELLSILNFADQLKFEKKNNIEHKRLSGKTLGMIFNKCSTRTRVSFEVGMFQLGGSALFLSGNDLQLGRGEPIEDTAKVLSRYVDGITIRTYKQEEVEQLASFSTIPVINGLTDYAHPCQVIADLMTIRELKGSFKNLKLCYIGDGNNMANSLIVGCNLLGIKVSIASPDGYLPDSEIAKSAQEKGMLELTNSPEQAAKDADIVYTDVWASMGQEAEAKERAKAFSGFQVSSELMSFAKSDAIVLHCLPAHRGEEITAEIMSKHNNSIMEQAENRLHAQKAILVSLMSR